MTGIFRANNPSGNAILFVYAIVLKLPLFLNPAVPELNRQDGVLYKELLELCGSITGGGTYIYSAVTFVLLFLQAISFNRIVNSQRMHKQPNYLTGMSFLLITSLFSEWFTLSAPLIVNSLLIWIFAGLCSLYNNPTPKATIFNIGLAAGLCTFFYFPSGAFILLIMVGVTIARPFRLREWLTGLLGIITPLYFFAAYLYLTDQTSTYKFPGISFSYPHFYGNTLSYVGLAALGVCVIAGVYHVNANLSRQVVHARKCWQLLLLYLIVAAVVPFLNADESFSYWILLTVPLAPITAAAFLYPKRKWMAVLLHWGLFGIYVAIAYFRKF